MTPQKLSETTAQRLFMEPPDFKPFPKISRLSREIIVTEKIDGTNGLVYVSETGKVRVGSRNRWITPEQDNFGFAKWTQENSEDLKLLGPGFHYGEWWGSGIQRGYGLSNGEKRFSLFNASRWETPEVRPPCCSVVPVLYRGEFDTETIDYLLDLLKFNGSYASPRFMDPEGIIIYHTASRTMFKKTLENDHEPKGIPTRETT